MKPRIFIGSSLEGMEVANSIQELLQYDFEPTVWNQDIFKLSKSSLESLVEALDSFDFAIFVFNDDDTLILRDKTYSTARDNVAFELGSFIGKLGTDRVFFIIPQRTTDFHLPSDLAGITPGTFNNKRKDKNLVAAVNPFCNQVKRQIYSLNHTGIINLSGEWSERWKVEGSKRFKKDNEDENVILSQNGNIVSGTHKVKRRTYGMNGKIKDQFLPGTLDDIESGGTYHGAFQLRINPDGETLEGQWLGFDTDNKFKHNIWEWKRKGTLKYPSEL